MTILASRTATPRPRASAGEYKLMRPDDYSVMLGRAHHRHAVRIPHELNALLISPPRTGKTALLARIILHYNGAVLSTTTRGDVYRHTERVRRGLGRIDVLNPQGLGGIPSTMAWDVIGGTPEDPGCLEIPTAIRRADSFAYATSTKGMDGDSAFWQDQASSMLRGFFLAAAFARSRGCSNYGLASAARWAVTDRSEEAEEILHDAQQPTLRDAVSQLRSEAQKTAATVRMVMSRALCFMADPALASAVQPRGDEPGFQIESFLRQPNTLYLTASGQGDNSPLAPLFATLTSEVHHLAGLVGSTYPGGRLPYPLLYALDEVTQICPVKLDAWMPDSGGRGEQIIAVAHGFAQLRNRWGSNGAQIIKDTAGAYIVLGGVKDEQTLEALSTLCGTITHREHGADNHSQHAVMTPAMLRQLPRGRAIIIRDNLSPVIFAPCRVWKDKLYQQSRSQPQHSLSNLAAELPAAVTDAPLPADLVGV